MVGARHADDTLLTSHLAPHTSHLAPHTSHLSPHRWAQYAESNARFKEALSYYEKAVDHLSIVRVLCFHNKVDRAAEVVNQSGDDGAAYHLAKQYESKGLVKQVELCGLLGHVLTC